MPADRANAGSDDRPTLGRRIMPPFAALRAFEAVGKLGGIRRAAAELGINHAAISRHLRALEEWAGVKLIDRERAGGLTVDGAKYHARISAALEEISLASGDLTRRGDDRRLVVWCIPGFAYRCLNPRLAEFSRQNPEIDIEVRPTDQSPDFSRHEADADLRYLRNFELTPGSEIQSVEIARPAVIPVVNAETAAKLAQPISAQALLSQPLLHENDDWEWRSWFQAKGVEPPERLPGPRLWHAHLTLDAASRGQGITLTNALLLGDDLTAGRLVPLAVTPQEPVVRFGSYVFQARRDRWRNPAVVKFRRWLERIAAQHEDA